MAAHPDAPPSRFDAWLAVARRYFEHRATCPRCVDGSRACGIEDALRLEGRAALRVVFADRGPDAEQEAS